MNGKQYWKDKIPLFIINIVCMVLLSVFLFFVGNNVDSIAVILIIWTMLLAGIMTFTYHQRKRRLNKLVKMAEGLEEKFRNCIGSHFLTIYYCHVAAGFSETICVFVYVVSRYGVPDRFLFWRLFCNRRTVSDSYYQKD